MRKSLLKKQHTLLPQRSKHQIRVRDLHFEGQNSYSQRHLRFEIQNVSKYNDILHSFL